MTIQSPGAAASTASWMDWNRPRLPFQMPTVHTLGLGPFPAKATWAVAFPSRAAVVAVADAAVATLLRPKPSRIADATAAIRCNDPRARPVDLDVSTALTHPRSAAASMPRHVALCAHYAPNIIRFHPGPTKERQP